MTTSGCRFGRCRSACGIRFCWTGRTCFSGFSGFVSRAFGKTFRWCRRTFGLKGGCSSGAGGYSGVRARLTGSGFSLLSSGGYGYGGGSATSGPNCRTFRCHVCEWTTLLSTGGFGWRRGCLPRHRTCWRTRRATGTSYGSGDGTFVYGLG